MRALSELKKENKGGSKSITGENLHSIVKSVEEPKDYEKGEAFLIRYDVFDENGEAHKFKELFVNKAWNQRTTDFITYLEEHDISREKLEEFVGCEEILEIRKKATIRGSFPSIVNRQFVGKGGDTGAGMGVSK